jgi:predicted metalloprotease
MKWEGRRESTNVDDRRGMSTGGMVAGGGIVGVVIWLLVAFLGGDTSQIPSPLEQVPAGTAQPMSPAEQQADDARASFVKVVLADTEDVWGKIFAENGQRYPAPSLVLFRRAVQSACGGASSASGPFYCPGDQKLYIDLSFYEEMQNNLNAPGDFSMAYVVAHEVGHHIQTINGTSEKIQRMRSRVSEAEGNRLSVMMELQADFLAGVWAHHAHKMKNILEPGDIEEALNAANAIGDDRLQKRSTGTVMPDAFTHGTSAQRVYWFKKGFETGDLNQGNTFNGIDPR